MFQHWDETNFLLTEQLPRLINRLMTAPLFALAGLLLYLAIFTANAQIPVGFTPGLPNGPFNGSHIDNDHSSVDIGSPSGRISFGLQETPNTWAKQLSFTGDINPGGLVSITEHLNWDGTGPAPFTDWHEQVLTSNFEWQAGSTISIGPSPGSVSSGNTQIDFNFPPQFSALDFTISKTLQ